MKTIGVLDEIAEDLRLTRKDAIARISEWMCDQAALRPTRKLVKSHYHVIGKGNVPAPRPYTVPAFRTQITSKGRARARLGTWPDPETGDVPGGPDRASIQLDGHLAAACCKFHQVAPVRTTYNLHDESDKSDSLRRFFKNFRRDVWGFGVRYDAANDIALIAMKSIESTMAECPFAQKFEDSPERSPFTNWISSIRDSTTTGLHFPTAVPVLPPF